MANIYKHLHKGLRGCCKRLRYATKAVDTKGENKYINAYILFANNTK